MTVSCLHHDLAGNPAHVAGCPELTGSSTPPLDLRTQLVLRAGHLPTCGDGAEFPWDCTCDYAGFMDAMEAVVLAAQVDTASSEAPDRSKFKTLRGPETAYREALAELTSEAEGLDVGRVKQAVTNIAVRHNVVKDPPPDWTLLSFYGYTAAPAVMDAEIAAEYARLAAATESRP